MSIFACLASGSSTAAAEKVSARSTPSAAPRGSAVASNSVAVVELPVSVFVDRHLGKDPFFPDASYRKRVSPKPVPNPGLGGDVILRSLKLTGHGGIGTKQWAMINGVLIYLGESSAVRVEGNLHQIVVLEMKEQSVLVGIKDNPAQQTELKLDN